MVKAKSKTKVKIAKKATRKKMGKAVITVQGGEVAPTGAVTVKVKVPGKKKAKSFVVQLNTKSKAKIKLPKAARKGKYKVIVKYAGDDRHLKAKRVRKQFRVR